MKATKTRLTFFIILFCLWKNSTLMSPQTGSGWGNSKNMCLSSRRVWAGCDVWIFTFNWYTTNWGSVTKPKSWHRTEKGRDRVGGWAARRGEGSGGVRLWDLWGDEKENTRRRGASDRGAGSESRERDRIPVLLHEVWQKKHSTSKYCTQHYLNTEEEEGRKSYRAQNVKPKETQNQRHRTLFW